MNKREIRDYLILFLNIILIVFLTTKFSYVFGSDTDWINQHTIIPEYFRQTFYSTGKILPNLAFNYGAGQNIFNLSYYGLLSPIILLSYLFPFVSMTTYIISINIILLMLSAILFYRWIKSHNFSSNVCLVTSLLFILSPPLIFQMHRHMMFVNYMPFLILSLMGVDKYLNNKNKILLIIGIFLMIMTSYYYSVCGILVVSIYYLYRYITINNNIKFKNLIKDGIKYILLVFISILMSSILLLPTAYTLLQGRGESTSVINILQLFTPYLKIYKLFNGTYSIGLSMIAFISLLYLFYTKKKSNVIFASFTSLIIFMPIFMYLLNGGLYLREKCFIPFIPIFGYMIGIFLNDLFNKKVNTKDFVIFLTIILIPMYYYNQRQLMYLVFVGLIPLFLLINKKYVKNIISISLVLIAIITSGYEANKEEFITKDMLNEFFDEVVEEEINNTINNDNTFYRANNLIYPTKNVNKIYNQRYYTTSIYSSTYNENYLSFVRDTFETSMLEYNYFLIPSYNNLLFNSFMGVKYSFSSYDLGIGYSKINDNTYLNNEVLPIIYSTDNLVNVNEFNSYNYPYQTEILLKNAVVNNKTNNKNDSTIKKVNIDYKIIENDGVVINKKDNGYNIEVEDIGHLTIELENELNNEFLFINLNGLEENKCNIADNISITINNVKNILTCSTWTYANKNNDFKFVISDKNIKYLYVELTKGVYKIDSIDTYILDYEDIKGRNNNVDSFNLSLFENDAIKGSINVSNDNSYLVTSIPYDKGYTIKVDNKEVDYELVNNGFIGFSIGRGEHNIEINYNSPLLNEGIIFSVIGLIIFIFIVIWDVRKKKSLN